jgi:fluoroacetyl-CoA thioesterase
MNFQIDTGVQGHQTKIVEIKDTALNLGSGLAEVYATPSLVALMELTAFKSIEPFLAQGYSTVGIQINVQHKKASLPGAIITCKSEVSKVDGKRIHFVINAYDEEEEIGFAEHIRYIVHSEEFMNRLKKDK